MLLSATSACGVRAGLVSRTAWRSVLLVTALFVLLLLWHPLLRLPLLLLLVLVLGCLRTRLRCGGARSGLLPRCGWSLCQRFDDFC